ncbi:MAG: FAD binding domain-containing protein [Acidobacteriaceae bacterium]
MKDWKPGFAWLAGGTWLFSEPQVGTNVLIDLGALGWPALTVSPDGLEIAATCKTVELDQFVAPKEWRAAWLFRECCRAFLASFKIWNVSTVGGNIVMSLPAGPMISLTAALEGVCTLWPRNGAPRQVPVADFVTGNHTNVLAPGELLRSIRLPATALRKRCAFRRFSLVHMGRSEVLLIGTRCPEKGTFLLTVTAATNRPIQLRFDSIPTAGDLKEALDHGVSAGQYFDDPNGSPSHRQHLSYYFAEQIRQELSGDSRVTA